MEGFSFVTPKTGLNRPNTGKEDDDDERKICLSALPCLYVACDNSRTFEWAFIKFDIRELQFDIYQFWLK
jgi:hypothetical protein